jgi:hypothetical protein
MSNKSINTDEGEITDALLAKLCKQGKTHAFHTLMN